MTLDQLKAEAIKVNEIDIQWDMLESDEKHRADFEKTLELVSMGIPGLEYIYTMLQSGNSSLPITEQETLLDACADELFAAYQMVEVYDRYKLISEITV
jgi:hypothetical protein